MMSFDFFATPWWVNVGLAIPFVAWWFFHKRKLDITGWQLAWTLIFGIAFGFVEAAVVIYLRLALGMFALPSPLQLSVQMSSASTLFKIEFFREAATMIMLLMVAFLAHKNVRERWAIFLWSFAAWDAAYYLFLALIIHWPPSLATLDLLFLIPVPWYAPVWFPLLIDALTAIAVLSVVQSKRTSK